MNLYECAAIIRSKNAGPFTVTIDLFFPDQDSFELARGSSLLTVPGVAKAYGIDQSSVVGIYWDERILAGKVSVRRWSTCNDPWCPDLFGAHLHTPLAQGELTPQREGAS